MMPESYFCARCENIFSVDQEEQINLISQSDFDDSDEDPMSAALLHKETNDYCPSCRLEVGNTMEVPNHSGCCGRRNEGWRLRKLRLMFTVPIIVLPLAIFLTLVYSASFKLNPQQTQEMHSVKLPLPQHHTDVHTELVNPETFMYSQENGEVSVREVLQDLQTNFVPPSVNYQRAPAKYMAKGNRRKREVESTLTAPIHDFEGNVSSEEIVWTVAQPSNKNRERRADTLDKQNNSTDNSTKNVTNTPNVTNPTANVTGANTNNVTETKSAVDTNNTTTTTTTMISAENVTTSTENVTTSTEKVTTFPVKVTTSAENVTTSTKKVTTSAVNVTKCAENVTTSTANVATTTVTTPPPTTTQSAPISGNSTQQKCTENATKVGNAVNVESGTLEKPPKNITTSTTQSVPCPSTTQKVPDPSTTQIVPGSSTTQNVPGSSTKLNVPGSSTKLNVPGSSTKLNVPGSSTKLNVPGSSTKLNVPGSSTTQNVPGSSTTLNVPGSSTTPIVPGPSTTKTASAPSTTTTEIVTTDSDDDDFDDDDESTTERAGVVSTTISAENATESQNDTDADGNVTQQFVETNFTQVLTNALKPKEVLPVIDIGGVEDVLASEVKHNNTRKVIKNNPIDKERTQYMLNSLVHNYPNYKPPVTPAKEIFREIDMSNDEFPPDYPPDDLNDFPWNEDYDYPDSDFPEDDENNEEYNADNDLRDVPRDEPDPEPDHSFWRDEGDKMSIRRAQAKLMQTNMDIRADPCIDFYQYACGNWDKQNPIPRDKGGYDTFEKLRESLDDVLKELLEAPVNNPKKMLKSADSKVKARFLYQSCMNIDVLEERGLKPLFNLLEALGGWPVLDRTWDAKKFDWLLLTAQLRLFNNDILIAEWVGPDIKNSDEYIIQIDQTSLGLPTRDYFLNPSNAIYLQAYKTYMINVMTLLDIPAYKARDESEEIVQFETELATITISSEDRLNVSELYRRTSLGELRRLVPQIDWYRYLCIVLNRDVMVEEPLVVFTINFFESLVSLLANTPPRTIANYLLWRFVRHRVNNLDDRFLDAKQDFYYTLFGREQAPPRWKNCVSQVNSNMGMAVGAMFVQKYFDENSKNDTMVMTEGIMKSFRQLLKHNSWIDKETKILANLKVDAMLLRIGYPNFILDPDQLDSRYTDIVIYPEEYFENTLKVLKHLTRAEQDRLGAPVNKTVWNTAPAVVNAYYSRNKNQIMFPAGILQPPFYHRFFPRSLNYGGIGVVIGHELTHGFDDKGRLFDRSGNLHRWWLDESIENFHVRAQCLIDQYSNFIVDDINMPIDGVSTQGENIADNGGIKQAFRAYKNWLKHNKDDGLPGMNKTNEELFFINFAQVWCGSMRPEAMRSKMKTAVHSPGKFRVIGTLSNSKDFSRVYKCPTGSPMNPKNKCSVW